MCTDKLFPTRNTAGRNKYLCFHTLASWLARVNKIKTHIRTKYNKWSWDSSLNIIPCWENEHADKIPRRELYWERGEPCIVWWWISILWLLNNNININSLLVWLCSAPSGRITNNNWDPKQTEKLTEDIFSFYYHLFCSTILADIGKLSLILNINQFVTLLYTAH